MSDTGPGNAGSGGVLLKLGLLVLSLGVCALAMLAMRQARLQAAHEVTQTQLRIQRADERLWKIRAEIAALSNPTRVRELAGTMGPLHALISPVEATANPSAADWIPTVEHPTSPTAVQVKGKPEIKPGAKAEPKNENKPEAKPDTKGQTKPQAKPTPSKPQQKPGAKENGKPSDVGPTGLAAAPVRPVLGR